MKKIMYFIVASIALVVVSSCGVSRKQMELMMQQQQMQQYPNYGGYQVQNQPQSQSQGIAESDGFEEVKKSPIEELSYAKGTNEIRAYGTATSKNEQLALNAARATATAALQEKIEVYVRAGLDRYIHGVGEGLDEMMRNQIVSAAKGVINGANVLDSRKLYNSNTKEYKYEVCMTYDRAGLMSVMQAQSDRIRSNEKQFEQDMQAAWDELDAHNGR